VADLPSLHGTGYVRCGLHVSGDAMGAEVFPKSLT
jgi:hypothetical protein